MNIPLTRPRRSPSRRRSTRLVLALCALPLCGALTSACHLTHASSPSHSSPPASAVVTSHSSGSTATTSTTTTTVVPQCGSNRDPFDPTGAPPPAGSPAHC